MSQPIVKHRRDICQWRRKFNSKWGLMVPISISTVERLLKKSFNVYIYVFVLYGCF